MKKLICFAFLAFFLAVSAVSTSHAADYPSDAPLPIVVVESVQGKSDGNDITLNFVAHISNYIEIQNRFGIETSQLVGFTQLTVDGERITGSIWFQNGYSIVGYQKVPMSYLGKTSTLATTQIVISSATGVGRLQYDVSPPLQFCTASIPLSLTAEWSDLQFTQANQPIIPNEMLIPLLVACVMAVGVVVAVSKKKS